MIESKGYAVQHEEDSLKPFSFQRRTPGPKDVLIDIQYCGICHSDLHQVKNEWNNALYPMVPGHEIVGTITAVGKEVTQFKVGDKAGVGCLVDSCRTCPSCHEHLEQYCETGHIPTYNSYEKDGETLTFGGYSNNIVVDEAFTLRIPDNLDLAKTAPLLCAGITTYSPLKHWQVQPGQRVGIIGLGGLGHMAIKIANAMGAQTTVFTHSAHKVEDAKRLGATDVVLTSDADAFKPHAASYDLLLNSASAELDLTPYLSTLKRDGTLIFLGVPDKSLSLNPADIIFKRKQIAGSLIGGIQETQEMLDFCAKHNITADIELIPFNQVNQAYERMLKGDVKYRFVIDISTLEA